MGYWKNSKTPIGIHGILEKLQNLHWNTWDTGKTPKPPLEYMGYSKESKTPEFKFVLKIYIFLGET
jgi:hypothetical protein